MIGLEACSRVELAVLNTSDDCICHAMCVPVESTLTVALEVLIAASDVDLLHYLSIRALCTLASYFGSPWQYRRMHLFCSVESNLKRLGTLIGTLIERILISI